MEFRPGTNGTLVPKADITKNPQTWWFKTPEIYCLIFLEDRGPKSRCWQGHAPSEACRRNPSLPLLVVVVNPGLAAIITTISACHPAALSLSLQISLF